MSSITATDPEVLLDRIEDLPALSPIVTAALSTIERADSQVDEIAALISKDTALATRVLRVVNSAFYGLSQQVSTISHAVVLLGYEAVKSVVLSTSVVEMMIESSEAIHDLKIVWERSLFSAVNARKLSHRIKGVDPEEVFMAALLMDVGMLVQLKLFGESYADVLAKELHEGEDIVVSEVRDFTVSHEALGEALLRKWDLPSILWRPVHYHHDLNGLEQEDEQVQTVARLIHLSRLAARVFYSPNKGISIRDYKIEANRLQQMSADEVDHFFRTIREEVVEVGRSFGMDVRNLMSYTEVLDIANQELAESNATYERMNRELAEAKSKAEDLARRLRVANERLSELASVDELTSLFNRRFFNDTFQREFRRCQRYQRPMTCILIDVDHFKQFNDTYGHQQGDVILVELAACLRSSLRGSDVAARYGGEEFVVLLPETSLYASRIAAEKLRRAVETHPFTYRPDEPLHVTISLGLACFDGSEAGMDPDMLLKRADDKLYESKANGRNRFSF